MDVQCIDYKENKNRNVHIYYHVLQPNEVSLVRRLG